MNQNTIKIYYSKHKTIIDKKIGGKIFNFNLRSPKTYFLKDSSHNKIDIHYYIFHQVIKLDLF